MLIQMKGILAITKHSMNKKSASEYAENNLATLRLACEKQISLISQLLRLRSDKAREEETRFELVLEYAELWSRNKRGRATVYEKKKLESMSAEMESYGEDAMTIAREDEIEATVAELKTLATEFQTAGQALQACWKIGYIKA